MYKCVLTSFGHEDLLGDRHAVFLDDGGLHADVVGARELPQVNRYLGTHRELTQVVCMVCNTNVTLNSYQLQ